MLHEIRKLAQAGINPLPTRPGKKTPGLTTFRHYQTDRVTPEEIEAWWGPDSPFCGVWVVCGAISQLVVLDVDSPAAEAWWRQRIGDAMDRAPRVRTRKGYHYWFAIPAGQGVQSWSVNDGDMRFDVLGDGKGAMAPPSPHPDGGSYEWDREIGDDGLPAAPLLLLDGGSRAKSLLAHPSASEGQGEATEDSGAAPRSLLTELLAHPPQEGGRNNWVAKVAGHYAAFKLPYDAYDASVRNAANLLPEPLPEQELAKTIQSVWDGDQRRHPPLPGQAVGPENGWLGGTGRSLLCEVTMKRGEDFVNDIVEWADFDVAVKGVFIDDDGKRTMLVQISSDHIDTVELEVPADTFGSGVDTARWLAGMGCSIVSPPGDTYGKIAPHTRLLRYMRAQNAPTYKPVSCLGWHDPSGRFIHADGWVTAEGKGGHEEWVPDPRIVKNGWARFRYGFEHDDAVARRVLAEVLEYHDPVVTAVFGSWCMAVMNKGQLMHHVDSFPFMGLEAPSESGKTTGFFAMMQQLCGNAGGHQQHTTASLRDALAVNRSGIVWCDDVTDTTVIEELLRHATVEGSKSKKGQDRTHTEEARLVGTVVLSGEGVQALHEQKALIDRCVVLAVPSPTDRRSVHNPDRLQWDDIVDLRERHPDLSVLAGWVLQAALEAGERWVPKMRELRTGPGRHGTKMAILRTGARILADVVGRPELVQVVDAWCSEVSDNYRAGDNTLVLQMLPTYLIANPYPGDTAAGYPAVFIDPKGTMWVNDQALAEWWETRYRHDARRMQTGSKASIKAQREAIGLVHSHRFSILSGRPRRAVDQLRTYYAIPFEVASAILVRVGAELQRSPAATDQLPM